MTQYTQLRMGRQPLLDKLPLHGPLGLFIDSTNRCNLSCPFCLRSKPGYYESVGGVRDLPFNVFARVVGDLAPHGLQKVRLYSGVGEPLMVPDIEERVRLVSDLGMVSEITTNGIFLTEKIASKLMDSGLTYLRVSDYGEQITVPEVYRVLERLRAMRDAAGRTTPQIVVKSFSEHGLWVAKGAHPNSADEWYVDSLHNWAGEHGDLGTPDARFVCPSPFFLLKVDVRGNVLPCCHTGDCNILGNVYSEPIMEIWNGRKMAAFREMQIRGSRFANPSCAKCTYITGIPDNLEPLLKTADTRRMP